VSYPKDFRGVAAKITDQDLPRIGKTIGVGEDEIHAILDVESSGSGFDKQGRPKMLFEPHVFFRNLTGAKRDEAVRLGLAYAKWKPGAYPKDSYPRLIQAIAIDETAALKAASWGLGQILGENHKLIGYSSPQALVKAFCESEAKQLEGIVAFLVANKLDGKLRAHDWAGVARGYNGASYAQHGYHTKLAAAFAKWEKIADTPLLEAPYAPTVTKSETNTMAIVLKNKKLIGTAVVFLAGGLSALGYGVPKPFVDLLVSLLGG